ncbi:PilZ domain-containing protein [Geomonas sp. Red69]|uniref:PilZ domain-containing protein n=1 Tax=Geomonas diazotrophica TaxID=2843197 RepID=A0ABX8JM85_9BACT|nr:MULTISPECIES: PilZ domain-containing protein [Geomonas]MBU5636964.1 PilZ domain-containing protein [Geomonas diazotrophica]QWV98863.1 PilZ domain-containing protein [Geomonas nitrogeniifigens]QXE88010.1 PilZ domain-containing protein [Geomonas nitrogeniifigens]
MEQRRFHRVTYSAPGELVHHDIKYRCRLENVSLRGALISADECLMVPLNESCRLTVPLEPGTEPLTLTVSVVHCFFSMIGVKFTGFTGDSELRLLELLKQKTSEPDKLMQEWESLKKGKSVAEEDRAGMPEPVAATY